jgi:hypothetical protein
MANEVQNGTAILHGITNGGSPISMSGYATFILETAKAGHKFKLEAIEDEVGFDRSLIATNSHVEVDIAWTPSGATRAAAVATAAFLTPLAKVTLANFAVAAFNGDWIYVGDQSIDLSNAAGKMSLKVRKYDDSTQNSSLSTAVSG